MPVINPAVILFQMGDSRQEMKEKIAKEKKVIPDPIEAKIKIDISLISDG